MSSVYFVTYVPGSTNRTKEEITVEALGLLTHHPADGVLL